jgi:hypothetical protein
LGIATGASNGRSAQDARVSTGARQKKEPVVFTTQQDRQNRWAKGKKQEASARPKPDRRSLKEAVGARFKIGAGVSHRVLQQPEDAALIRQQFQILTPENCMKP